MTEQTHEYAFVTTLSAVARIRATSEDEARNLLTEIECLDLTGVTICDGVVVTEASLCEETASAELFEIDGKEIDDTDPDDCDCSDRSWYGPEHDSACPHAGEERPAFACR